AIASALAVELAAGGISAELQAELTVLEGTWLALEANVARSWAITAVESVSSTPLAEWSIDSSAAEVQTLRIRFGEALVAGKPLRLRIRAESLRPPLNSLLDITELSPLAFPSSVRTEQIVNIAAQERLGLRIIDDVHLTRLERQTLESPWAELLGAPPPGLLFKNDDPARALRIAPYEQPPRYSAETRIRVTADAAGVEQAYEFRCQPQGDRVEQLYVRFVQEQPEPCEWRWGLARGETLSARRLTSEECAARDWTSRGETWEVRLPSPQHTPFVVTATQRRGWEDRLAVNLVALPEAAVERALISLWVAPDVHVDVLNSRLRAQPQETPQEQEPIGARGAYRYDPAIDSEPGIAPPLELARVKADGLPPRAVVWTGTLRSRYSPAGRAVHTASYRVQNDGVRELGFQLPPEIQLAGVWVDAERIAVDLAQRVLHVPLPDRPRFVTVTIEFTESVNAVAQGRWLEAPRLFPQLPHAPVEQEWVVELPAGYALVDASPALLVPGAPATGFLDRLLGAVWSSAAPRGGADLPMALGDAARQPQRAPGEAFLGQIGTSVPDTASSPADAATTLGALLVGAAAALPPDAKLLIDRVALARADINPQSEVTLEPTANGADRGLALLARHGLALICLPRQLVLTSQAWWSAHAAEMQVWRQSGWGAWHDPATLAREVELVSLNHWISDSHPPWSDWREVTATSPGSAPVALIRAAASEPMRARVVSVPRGNVLAVAIALAAFAVAWRVLTRGSVVAAWLLVLTALALLAPTSWIPLTSAAWLAGMAGACARCLRVSTRSTGATAGQASAPSSATSAANVVAGLLAGWLIVAAAPRAAAAEPALPAGRETYRVFVPADATGKPTGEDLQVPEELLFQLERAAREAARAPQGYLIREARYHGTLLAEKNGASHRLDPLRVSYRLDVLTAPARIELPYSRQQVDLLPGTARLDGLPVSLTWGANERTLLLVVAEPGEHQLEFTLSPRLETAGEMRRMEVAIPPVVDATLELELPDPPLAIEIVGALGSTERREQGRRLWTALGSVPRLALQWPEGAAGAVALPEVEEFVWLSVRPGSVTVELRLKYQLAAGRVVRIAADPRLRLLSGGAARTAEAASPAAPGERQVLEFQPVAGAGGEAVVAATFLMTGTSGVGKLRVPQLDPLGARVTRRWLAFSIDPALEFVEAGAAELSTVTAADFLVAWGAGAEPPNGAYLIPSNDVAWTLGTQPRQTVTNARQRQQLTLSEVRAALRFEAQLDTTAGYVFQHTLRIPPDLTIDRVAVTSENTPRAVRWTRSGPAAITIFLDGPLAGEHRLEIEGSLVIAAGNDLALPWLSLENVATESSELALYRRAGVHVELTPEAGLEPLGEAPVEWSESPAAARSVGFFRVTAAAPRAGLRVAANAPRTDSLEITTLSRNAAGWQATFRCVLQTTAGTLDEVVLEVPSEWEAPFRCVPQFPLRVLEAPIGGQRRILIWPSVGADGRTEFTLHGALRPSVEHGLQSPPIHVAGAAHRQRYLVLPHEYGAHQLQWGTRGLEQAPLPDAAGITVAPTSVSYQVTDARGEAVLGAIDDENPRQRVSLADYSLRQAGTRTPHGVALFDLEPAGELTCPLSVPKTCELIQVFVEGQAVNLTSAGDNRYTIRVGPKSAPLRIQVLFRLRDDGRSGTRRRWEAPRLGELPVERTIWRVSTEPGESLMLTGGTPLSPLDYALARVRSVAGLLDFLGRLAEEGTPDEAVRNFRPWARRLRAAKSGVERVLAASPAAEAERVRAELAAVDAATVRLARRLGATEVWRQVNEEPLRAAQPGQIWEDLALEDRATDAAAFAGAHPTLECRATRDAARSSLLRGLLAAGCVIAAGLILRRGTGRAGVWFERRQRALVPLGLGMLGLLAGSGSLLGMLLLAAAVAAGLGVAWINWKQRHTASTEFVTTAHVHSAPAAH
ncbi:MAG: hypothetical protein JNG90_00215, partial [Planctomycetaceae bacterium]|nr:hypothetical protein [Planctomycetaceae bacterium]